jgi:glyoxylase-like metal-dependent hydrolase (beta-lactamase superfamily II)
VNLAWERLADGIHRCRLPFLDVTVGLVCGRTGTLLIDTGTTLLEANAVKADVAELAGSLVSHIVLTHNHFDHILGSSAFADATVYCAPEVAATIATRREELRADAVRHGADADEVTSAIAALQVPRHRAGEAVLDLGGRSVTITHPGPGHTNHDLIVVVADAQPAVVFCGDLVEESGDPVIGPDSDQKAWPATLGRVLVAGGPDAAYVPGHGAVVDADFVQRQGWMLRST